MRQTVEEMLGYFNQIRRVYANELNLKFANENFSPNEISILILLFPIIPPSIQAVSYVQFSAYPKG